MRAPAITFLICALGYALLLCPSQYWLDSGELAAASFELGIAHAPGQPLAMLLGKLFCFLPLGDVSLRVGLGQAFCGAGAAAVVAWLGRRLAAEFVEDSFAREVLGIAAGVAYAASYAAGFQAIRPEVYALSALLVLSAIALCLRYVDDPQPRHLGLAGLCFGLGLANHHYLTVLGAVPPALVLLWRKPDATLRRGLVAGVLATCAGFAIYIYLPLRAAHDPIIDWGHPSTLSSFWWTVTARSFQKSAALEHGRDALALLAAVFEQLTPAAPLLALAGLYLCLRGARRLGLALAFAIVGPVGARLVIVFDRGNPDALAYLSTAIAALAIACVPLPAALVSSLPGAARRAGALAVLATALAFAVLTAPRYSLAHFEDTRAIYAPLVTAAPADAVMVPAYFQTTFALEYLRVAEGLRPDLSYLPRHFLDQPGLAQALVRRDARLSSLLAGTHLDVAALLSRPAWVEYDLDLDTRLVARASVVPTPQLSPDADPQKRRFALWQRFLRLHQLCRLGASAVELNQAEQGVRQAGEDRDGRDVDLLLGDCAALRGR
jgi:hypothetical protein